jgi:hypothetical protein
MSTLTGLISGGGGGGIKSVQRGTVTTDFNNTSTNVTISAVDLSKSFLVFSSATGSDADNNYRSNLRGRLTTTTNINFYRYAVNTNSSLSYCFIAWEVIEYE